MTEEKFSNKAVAHLLRSVAASYLIKETPAKEKQGNRFKIIAYERAADAVEHSNREIKDVWQEGKLQEIPGIGASIADHLNEYFKTGTSKHFQQVMKSIPPSVFELMNVRSLGPKRAHKLVETLHLDNPKTVVEDLKRAIEANKVAKIPSFGSKSQEDILEAIKIYEGRLTKKERMPLPYAFAIAQDVLAYLKKNPKVKRAEALGSLRRMVSTIGDIDVAAAVTSDKDAEEVVQYFIQYPKAIRVEDAGPKKASIIIRPNTRIDLRVQEVEDFGSMLQYFTGSKSHNINLREFALKKGYSLSEYGIKNVHKIDQNVRKFKNEEDFYNFLGLQYVPPEIREGSNEIDLAKKKEIPHLVELKDIKGDLHVHTSYDLEPSHDLGENTPSEVMEKAMSLGYEYVGFADHNPRITGRSESEVNSIMKARKQYLDKIFCSKKFERSKYFIGMETDILPDGKIALPKDSIQYVDYQIVSIHSSFAMSSSEMTKRVLEALKSEKVKIFGHPTGRLLGKRDEYELDWELIFDTCKKNNIALEINAWPLRLDLPDTLVRRAVDRGVKLAINSDAHTNSEMEMMFYGVEVARRGWAKKTDIINTLSYQNLREWFNR